MHIVFLFSKYCSMGNSQSDKGVVGQVHQSLADDGKGTET